MAAAIVAVAVASTTLRHRYRHHSHSHSLRYYFRRQSVLTEETTAAGLWNSTRPITAFGPPGVT